MIKIAFSGIPLSGKSTLMEEVKKILALKSRVETVDDITHSSSFDTDQAHTFPVQFYNMTMQINHENLKAGDSPEILLCDRSVLDHWVEWKKHTAQLEKDIDLEEKERLLFYLYRFWIKTYNLIVLLRVDPKIVVSREQQERFDLLTPEDLLDMEEWFLRTIKEDGLKTIEIWNQQTMDEAAEQILKEIYEQFLLD